MIESREIGESFPRSCEAPRATRSRRRRSSGVRPSTYFSALRIQSKPRFSSSRAVGRGTDNGSPPTRRRAASRNKASTISCREKEKKKEKTLKLIRVRFKYLKIDNQRIP